MLCRKVESKDAVFNVIAAFLDELEATVSVTFLIEPWRKLLHVDGQAFSSSHPKLSRQCQVRHLYPSLSDSKRQKV